MSAYTPYLQRSESGIYYFRLSVPSHLRPILGRREIKRSLRTGYKRRAARLARLLAYESWSSVQRLEARMASKYIRKAQWQHAEIESIRRHPDRSIETRGVKLDPEYAEAELKLLEGLKETLAAGATKANGVAPVNDIATAQADDAPRTLIKTTVIERLGIDSSINHVRRYDNP